GPVPMIAAYVGYKVAGIAGASVAAGSAFLPSFVIMLAILPVLDRVRQLAWVKAVMRGMSPAVIGVLAVSLVKLAPGGQSRRVRRGHSRREHRPGARAPHRRLQAHARWRRARRAQEPAASGQAVELPRVVAEDPPARGGGDVLEVVLDRLARLRPCAVSVR